MVDGVCCVIYLQFFQVEVFVGVYVGVVFDGGVVYDGLDWVVCWLWGDVLCFGLLGFVFGWRKVECWLFWVFVWGYGGMEEIYGGGMEGIQGIWREKENV